MNDNTNTTLELVAFDSWGFDAGSVPIPSAQFDKWAEHADDYFFANGNYVELWIGDNRLTDELNNYSEVESAIADFS